MRRCLLVYSSVTGNTRMVAEAVRKALPPDAAFFPVREAPPPNGFDLVVLGFWAYRAGPDPLMTRYMDTVRGRTVAVFGTLAAYPDSEHAGKVVARAEELLAGNRFLDSFLCQGKLAPGRFERLMQGGATRSGHPMTEERRARLIEASRHPDAMDLQRAEEAFRTILSRTEKRT